MFEIAPQWLLIGYFIPNCSDSEPFRKFSFPSRLILRFLIYEMHRLELILLALSLFALSLSAFGPDCSPITTVPDFDLVPYMGIWYEQGTSNIPRQTFQRGLYCTHAEYELAGSFVNVNNSGLIGEKF
jgi:hypothetical protein